MRPFVAAAIGKHDDGHIVLQCDAMELRSQWLIAVVICPTRARALASRIININGPAGHTTVSEQQIWGGRASQGIYSLGDEYYV
jgi:hypothetical protein